MEQEGTEFPHPGCLDINHIPATFQAPPADFSYDEQSPYPWVDGLFEGRTSVPNCYFIESNEYRVKFQMKSVLAKAAFSLVQKADFQVVFEQGSFVLFGMNFAGRLRIRHGSNINRQILLPGCLSYDPAGTTGHRYAHEFLTNESALFLLSVVATQVRAAREGAPQAYMSELHEIHSVANRLYIGRQHLMNWMTEQVVFACYPRPNVSRMRPYPDFLLDNIRKNELNIMEKGHGHTKEYLEWYLRLKEKKATERQVRPPYQYYYALRHYFPEEQLRSVTKDQYDNVVVAAEGRETGQGVFLYYLPRVVPVTRMQGKETVSFEELRRRAEAELKAYQKRLEELDQEIITEVGLLKESQRTGEKCVAF